MTLPRLLLLTDRSQLPLGRSLVATLRECVAAGASAVVVRELDLPEHQRAALVQSVVGLGATVIAARSPLPGAVGVHLPGSDWRGSGDRRGSVDAECVVHHQSSDHNSALQQVVGWSCHSGEEVRRAAASWATYATLSPYAASASKPGYGPPVSSGEFAGHDIPVYALGGIGPDNAGDAVAAGAHGVAVMGAVMRSADPGDTVARLLAEVGR
jgi:thiamine-phosphate pyrophosphorylase